MAHLVSTVAFAGLAMALGSSAGAQLVPPVPPVQIPVEAPGAKLTAGAIPAPRLRKSIPDPAISGVAISGGALPSPGKALSPIGSAAVDKSLTSTIGDVLGPTPLPSVSLGTDALPLGTGALPLSTDTLPLLGTVTTKPILGNRTGATGALPRTSVVVQGAEPTAGTTLLERRRSRIEELLRQHPHELETDEEGRPIRRGILIAVDADPAQLRRAAKAGFPLVREERHLVLGLRLATLTVPNGMSAPEAMKRLRRAAPLLDADYDHLFQPSAAALAPAAGALAAGPVKPGVRIGMIDGGVGSHPSLADAPIAQRGFAGVARPTGHGTAVASLMVGREGRFRGAARGASLLVGDVYGGNRAAGSASVIVRALGWLVSNRASVVNISLVGPPNKALARAVKAVRARGVYMVAAVGNDGPAAPPPYPASYPSVIAVTGVDARGRALVEATKVDRLDFAAPGADMAAARPGRGYAKVRGTSFASPLAAARLAAVGSTARLAAEARPGKGRVGHGIVCGPCRTDPKLVGAR